MAVSVIAARARTAPGICCSTTNPSGAFYFSFDVGVILARPKGTLNYTCTASAAICSNVATDVAAQKSKLDTTIGSVTVLPLLQFGVGYRF